MEPRQERPQIPPRSACEPVVVPPGVNKPTEQGVATGQEKQNLIYEEIIDKPKKFCSRRVVVCVCIVATLTLCLSVIVVLVLTTTNRSSRATTNQTERATNHMQKDLKMVRATKDQSVLREPTDCQVHGTINACSDLKEDHECTDVRNSSSTNNCTDTKVQLPDIPRKKTTHTTIIIIVALLIAAIPLTSVVTVVVFEKYRKPTDSPTQGGQTAALAAKSNTTAKVNTQYIQKEATFVQVVGSGNKHLILQRDESFSHWLLQIRRGSASLKSLTYIIVDQDGIYQIYAQVAVTSSSEDSRASIKLMRNRNILSQTVIANCTLTCTMYTSKLVKLQKGDYIYMKAGVRGEFIMDQGSSYFGILLV